MTNPEQLRALVGKAPVRKIKAENVHAVMNDPTKMSPLLSDMFAAAHEVLAPGGVFEYGMTGPLNNEFGPKMGPAYVAAHKAGFEPVEVRSNMTFGHTFSQSDDGMRDKRRVQVVFARAGDEAAAVRDFYATKQKAKSEDPSRVADPLKMRAIVPSRASLEETITPIAKHHSVTLRPSK